MSRSGSAGQDGRAVDEEVVTFATTVGIGEFELTVTDVVAGVVDSGCPAFVTQHGVPVAAVVPLDLIQAGRFG